jgi:2,3-bisphosphoglycerate-dependent phosphoglycerate mutase
MRQARGARFGQSVRATGDCHDEEVTSPTRLILIRHGESRSVAEGWLSGRETCRGLTDMGRDQAKRFRRRAAADPDLLPDVVITSTMRRALETAEVITSGLGIVVDRIDELCERIPGECEGMTVAEYRVRYGREPWSDWEEPLSPGGEGDAEFVARVRAAITAVADRHQGRTVWIVCHGGVIMATANLLMESPTGRQAPQWDNPRPTALSEWVRVDGPWVLRRYNDYGHLT